VGVLCTTGLLEAGEKAGNTVLYSDDDTISAPTLKRDENLVLDTCSTGLCAAHNLNALQDPPSGECRVPGSYGLGSTWVNGSTGTLSRCVGPFPDGVALWVPDGPSVSLQTLCNAGGCAFTDLPPENPMTIAPSGLSQMKLEFKQGGTGLVEECIDAGGATCQPPNVLLNAGDQFCVNAILGSPASEVPIECWTNPDGTTTQFRRNDRGIYVERPPTASYVNQTYLVTDCLTAACNSGGGSIAAQTRWMGSAWVVDWPDSAAVAPETFQELFETGGRQITGLTASTPFELFGTDPFGAKYRLYESSGDMFFECVMADGTFCEQIYELDVNKQFRIGTVTLPDAWHLSAAEPETPDTACRTTDPTAPTADRMKLYCKNDAFYVRTDTAVIGPLGTGGSALTLDLGDDSGNDSTALAEIATTGDTTGIFTESSPDKLLINATKPWPGGVTSYYLDAIQLVPDGTNCVSGVVQINSGPLTDVLTCADTTSSSIFYGKLPISAIGGCPSSTLNFSLHVQSAGTASFFGDFSAMYRRWGGTDAINNTWGSAVAADVSLGTANEIETATASVTPNGTCSTSAFLFFRYVVDGANYDATTAHVLGITVAQP